MSEMHNPAHPGEVLREYLPEGMSVTDAAKALNVTRAGLVRAINGRSGVSAEMALRLEAALGVEAGFWLRTQVAYDLWEARQRGVARGVRNIAA
ncbi:HigA family addiction module antitoxin [Acidithiobacillus ferrivorans]|uniref:HigA family addiction module antitoxin n=1 Tax=Acidithiobacillus ferrivorans TaxID=160808 RepID=UPI001C07533E|nr:HigA family addiction module antitoxin [Acidithiobacillus ferrivorans]MBU2852211.1 HigA family addiction module antidote protein [Acidithiobacillus ferrivorans]